MTNREQYPTGWSEERVRKVLEYYEQQSDEEAVTEDNAAFARNSSTVMEVPVELVPKIREIIARHLGTT